MNRQQLVETIRDKKSFLCVGLDTDITKLPAQLRSKKNGVFLFNKAIIDATKSLCVSYKLNTAFYESQGIKGWEALAETLDYIPKTHFTIADAKRGDIGNTSAQYAKTFFETYPFDAVTVAPYMGEDSIKPFLEYDNKWTIVLGLTSNAGAQDFQQVLVAQSNNAHFLVPSIVQPEKEKQLYKRVIERTASWGSPNNLMFVVGATKASELEEIRSIIPQHFLLVPGVGTQGGSMDQVCKSGMIEDIGLLVNVSRAIIYANEGDDYAAAAALAAQQYQTSMAAYLP